MNWPPPSLCPADTDGSVVQYPAASNVYHYHGTTGGPYTLGCYGPDLSTTAKDVSLAACQKLYPGCSSTPVNLCTSSGNTTAYLWCTCYQYHGVAGMGMLTPSSSCPACKGACSATGVQAVAGGSSTGAVGPQGGGPQGGPGGLGGPLPPGFSFPPKPAKPARRKA